MNFICVGENIHCTRVYKVGGKYVAPSAEGGYVINYTANGEQRQLPVPSTFGESADWANGKVKHCAVAISQAVCGQGDAKHAGRDYIQCLARAQEAAGATYLDINVDEFSTDDAERIALMKWTVEAIQEASPLPMAIDSSNVDILRAGLEACDTSRAAAMLNSVSLERPDAVALAAEFGACVIASAAGKDDLPSTTEGRLANLDVLIPKLEAVGITKQKTHVDPLVFPMSTDPTNCKSFLDAVAAIRDKYGPEIHIVAGLSNISFGMPNRKLLNQVFAHMAVAAGADGGIVDPLHINTEVLTTMDTTSTSYQLAYAALNGEDEYGMNYITAAREGSL